MFFIYMFFVVMVSVFLSYWLIETQPELRFRSEFMVTMWQWFEWFQFSFFNFLFTTTGVLVWLAWIE